MAVELQQAARPVNGSDSGCRSNDVMPDQSCTQTDRCLQWESGLAAAAAETVAVMTA